MGLWLMQRCEIDLLAEFNEFEIVIWPGEREILRETNKRANSNRIAERLVLLLNTLPHA